MTNEKLLKELDKIEKYLTPRFPDCKISQDKENEAVEIANDDWFAMVGKNDGIGYRMMFGCVSTKEGGLHMGMSFLCLTLGKLVKTIRREIAEHVE